MAVESIRRSGYRMVGGIYLVSDTFFKTEIQPLPVCKYCGQGTNLSRNITEIRCGELNGSFIAIVGKHFYPTLASFIDEAEKLGISKRVPFVAKNIQLGETRIYLAHPLALHKGWGIFGYFIPDRIEQLIWSSDYNKTYKPSHTIVRVPAGDLDHSPWRTRKLIND
jgi:hypothetical protein